MAYTEEELAGLTEAERAALEEDDGTETDGEEEEEEEDQHDEAESSEETEADAGDDADEGADDGEQQPDDGDDVSDEEAQPEPERTQQQGPILVAEAPERAEERLKEIGDEKKTLRQKYDDGELTFDEYESQVDALDEERMDIRLALKEAETAAKIEHQRQVNEREATINGFLAELGIKRDYSDLRFAALDNAVKIVASTEEAATLGAREILEKAHELCIEQGVLQPKKKPEAKAEPKVEVKPRKPLATVPTLAKVPAAEQTSADEGNRFAYIDRISDPVAREKAFQKLSDADKDAYLATA